MMCNYHARCGATDDMYGEHHHKRCTLYVKPAGYGVFEHHDGADQNTHTGYVVRSMPYAGTYARLEAESEYKQRSAAERHADKLNERYEP